MGLARTRTEVEELVDNAARDGSGEVGIEDFLQLLRGRDSSGRLPMHKIAPHMRHRFFSKSGGDLDRNKKKNSNARSLCARGRPCALQLGSNPSPCASPPCAFARPLRGVPRPRGAASRSAVAFRPPAHRAGR